MTSPTPPPAPPATAAPVNHGVINTVKTMPRWALAAIVVGGGLVAWYLLKVNSSTTVDPSWSQRARDLLTSRGYSQTDIDSALNHYLGSGTMTPQDVAMIGIVIRALGTPDMPSTPSVDATQGVDPPVTPDAGLADTSSPVGSTALPPASTGYWYVVSMGVGWSSTMRGIAQQFYGDTAPATTLMQLNPGIVPNDYSRIPLGTQVKIPRSLTV